MRTIVWICTIMLVESLLLYAGTFSTFGHNLVYGNPHERQWSCVGKCPPEVLKIEVDEDARHARENGQ